MEKETKKSCKIDERRTETDKQIYETANTGKTGRSVRNRCNILLMADGSAGKPAGWEEISRRCGVCDVTVRQTVKECAVNGLEYAPGRKADREGRNGSANNGIGVCSNSGKVTAVGQYGC